MVIAARQLEREGFTVEDVLAMPDDGLRYELLDGMLIVNPPPILAHQFALSRLLWLISRAVPKGWEVLASPIGWRPAETRWFEPDIVVVHLPDGPKTLRHLTEAPALVVEILSPSTRSYDQLLKRNAYDEGGVDAYWIVDPSIDTPWVTVLERTEGGGPLQEVARATGSDAAQANNPWSITIVPADLVR